MFGYIPYEKLKKLRARLNLFQIGYDEMLCKNLLDGDIHEAGRYKDRQQVIIEIRKIIDEIMG